MLRLALPWAGRLAYFGLCVGLSAGLSAAFSAGSVHAAASYLVVKQRATEFDVIAKFDAARQAVWTLNRKDWGTWNIFWLSLTDNEEAEPVAELTGRRRIAGGGTDWEYVFRGGPQPDESVADWMGGNHGNERLVSLRAVGDGREVDLLTGLAVGEALRLSSVVIREETRLVHPKMSGDVAAIVRTYEIQPTGMRFRYEVVWLQDVYLERAYMLMLPISKLYGTHVQFAGDSRVIDFRNGVKTDRFDGFVPALVAWAWGDREPSLRIQAYLDDPAAVLEYRHTGGRHAFVWDLTPEQVKLYFPRYVLSGFHHVPAGTRWEVTGGWALEVENAR